jgi:DNA-binding NarL/FixJ family response regulator
MSVRVLVVDDHRLAREWVRAELTGDDFTIVDEAATGAAAIAAVEQHHPDVVVLDLGLPDLWGSEVCSAILERDPRATVVVLSGYSDEHLVRSAIDAGARGYLLKDAEELDLSDAIRRVLAGGLVIDPRVARILVSGSDEPDHPKLSEQEFRVLRLVAEGLTNPEIGARLYLSRHTVKEYLSHVMRKLEVANRMEAVRKATALGLLDAAVEMEGGRPVVRRAENLVHPNTLPRVPDIDSLPRVPEVSVETSSNGQPLELVTPDIDRLPRVPEVNVETSSNGQPLELVTSAEPEVVELPRQDTGRYRSPRPQAQSQAQSQTCRIICCRGYVKSYFCVVRLDGTVLARSPSFRAIVREPRPSGIALAAHQALIKLLTTNGWEPVGRRKKPWYAKRFHLSVLEARYEGERAARPSTS